jgi:hypothetical protein
MKKLQLIVWLVILALDVMWVRSKPVYSILGWLAFPAIGAGIIHALFPRRRVPSDAGLLIPFEVNGYKIIFREDVQLWDIYEQKEPYYCRLRESKKYRHQAISWAKKH